ncbi:LOW QUALITY PROTEIN: hypothetical protein CFOL_v3_24031, partial [Cephalotus follicularis]
RFSMVEFPRFNGEDLNGLHKANQFFEVDATPEPHKVRLACIHLEGKVQQWHLFMKSYRNPLPIPWLDYVNAISCRFGDFAYEDPLADLKNPSQTSYVVEYMDAMYMEERRMKNLCFWCDEKFILGDKCKNRQVYIMEVEGITEEEGYKDCTSEDTALQPQVSLHALTGSIGQDIMQVVAVVGSKHLQVLIDSGITHNFLIDDIVQKLGLPLVDIPTTSMRIENSEQLHCYKMCKDF